MKTISRYIMTLALLLTAVTGAWADGISVTTEDFGKVICTDGSIYATEGEATAASKTAAAKIFFIDNVNKKGLALALADESGAMDWSTAKTTAAAHTPAVTGGTWKLATMDEWTNMREAAKNYQNDEHNGHSTFKNMANLTQRYWVNTEDEYDSNNAYYYIPYSGSQFGFSTDPKTNNSSCYVRACLEFNIASAAPEVKWDAATKTATFTMPGSDVVLTPIYAKAAAFATTGTEPEVKTLLPEAAEGVIAGTDASLIAEGTGIVAFAGTSTEDTQGTLMYAIGTSATEAPALTAFSATVPTAKDIADDGATLYVWYYIQGADAPEGQEATAENTFNDSEICTTPLKVTVLTNKFDIQFNAANANTIEAGKATVTVGGTDATVTEGKLQGVKMGSEVKLKANTGYKFRKVEVKKKAGPAADIVWDVTNVTDLQVEGDYLSYTKEGIKLSGNAEQVQAEWNNSAYLGTPGMEFITMESGGFTFTAPTGKKFTKIEMKAVGSSGWAQENLGTGWAYNTGTVTWNGSAASTVKLLKDADMFSGDFISSIAFYLSE